MTRTIDELLADSKAHIDAIASGQVWHPNSALGNLLAACAGYQAVLEELWERYQETATTVQQLAAPHEGWPHGTWSN